MEATYKRDAMHNYLVILQEVMERGEYFQEKMILENGVDGLLPCSMRTFNGENQYYYDISGKQTLACLHEVRQMSVKDLEGLLQGIADVINNMERYLLDADYLLLNPEYVYYDLTEKKHYFCFVPCGKSSFQEKLGALAEYLLSRINHQEKEAVVLGYQFYRRVKEGNSSFVKIFEELMLEAKNAPSESENFMERERTAGTQLNSTQILSEEKKWDEYDDDWEEIGDGLTNGQCKQFFRYLGIGLTVGGIAYGGFGLWNYYKNGALTGFITTTEFLTAVSLSLLGIVILFFSIFYFKDKNHQHLNTAQIQQAKQTNSSELSEDSYMEEFCEEEKEDPSEVLSCDDDGKTVLLSENMYREEKILVGLDKRKQYRIFLEKFPFIIGSSGEFADFVLPEKSISRMHVKFIWSEEENTVYMQDLNSTNGTFHNGIRVENGEWIPIYAGDEIQIGKRLFQYQ